MRLLLLQLSALCILAVLYFLGELYFLQWRLWWYDILLHGLGGLWVGLCLVWLYRSIGLPATLLTVGLGTLVIGAGWEGFEYVSGFPRESGYVRDTLIDMCMDLGGALLGYILTTRVRE